MTLKYIQFSGHLNITYWSRKQSFLKDNRLIFFSQGSSIGNFLKGLEINYRLEPVCMKKGKGLPLSCVWSFHGLQSARLLCPWDLPGKNTGVGYHFLLQELFPTHVSKLGLLHWQADSLPSEHQGGPHKYVYICACVCECVYTCMYICIYTYVCICVCIYMCIYICMYICSRFLAWSL